MRQFPGPVQYASPAMIDRQITQFLSWMAEISAGKCENGRHVLHMPGLRLQSPRKGDHDAAVAGASDPEAQRWLDWPADSLVPASRRGQLLSVRPRTRPPPPPQRGASA